MSGAAQPARRLLAIGGAEDKLGPAALLRRFVTEAGGPRAHIVVCATASALGDEIFALYEQLFTDFGATVVPARPERRADAMLPQSAAAFDGATGVFFTGGNQLKLSTIIRGTAFGQAVTRAYQGGAIVGGTSAGASVISENMISYGSPGNSPKHRMAGAAQGLGLLPGVIVDQHFSQRDRFGRLVSLVAASPDLLGLGLDEDTAILVHDETRFEVLGSGSVFCVDLREAVSDADTARGTAALMVSGGRVHFLPAGAHFDLITRELVAYREDQRLAPAAAAPGDLARLSRMVAAEGADDIVVARNARRRKLRAGSKRAGIDQEEK